LVVDEVLSHEIVVDIEVVGVPTLVVELVDEGLAFFGRHLRLPSGAVAQPPTPSCCMSPSMSTSYQLSTTLPSAIRRMPISVNSTVLPVAGIPNRSPWWV